MSPGSPTRLLALLLCLAARPALANGLDAFGFGARATALGSAYAAVGDDATMGYYNPAALARSQDLHIDVGYQAAVPRLAFSGVQQPIEATRGLVAGLSAPGRLGPVRFAFGVALFLPDQHVTRLRVLRFDQPRLQLYDNRTQRFFMAANLAVHIYRGLYLGGGLTFMSRTSGAVSLKGNVTIGDAEDSALYSQTAVDLVAIRYPQVGLLFELSRHLSLALVYRHRFVLDVEQGFNISADIGNVGQPPAVPNAKLTQNATSTDLFQPWQLVLGTALRPPFLERLQISLDLTFARWSEMPTPAATYDLALDIGRLNDLVKLQPSRSYPPAGFHDLLIPALGLEWRAAQGLLGDRLSIDLRGGYRYEPSPVPAQDGDSSFGDADKHVFSVGAGVELQRLTQVLPRPLSLDVFFAATYLPTRAFEKADPRSPTGDFTVSGAVVQAGAQLRWRL